jgi:hypothetical protein
MQDQLARSCENWKRITYSQEREEYPTYKLNKKRQINWTGHILRTNCILKHVTQGNIEERIEGNTRKKT